MQDFFVILHPFGVKSYKYKQRKMRLRVNSQTHFLVYPCDPCRIQTCNPHIRSVVLYSVELMDRKEGAVRTRLELATYGVTGRYSNQLNYRTSSLLFKSGCKSTAFF